MQYLDLSSFLNHKGPKTRRSTKYTLCLFVPFEPLWFKKYKNKIKRSSFGRA